MDHQINKVIQDHYKRSIKRFCEWSKKTRCNRDQVYYKLCDLWKRSIKVKIYSNNDVRKKLKYRFKKAKIKIQKLMNEK